MTSQQPLEKNPYAQIFSLIFMLYKDQRISLFEKRILKQGLFNMDDQLNKYFDEFEKTWDENKLQNNLLDYLKCKNNKSSPNLRNKSVKNSRTEISQLKIDQFSPRLSSDSKLHHLTVFEIHSKNDHKLEKLNSLENNMMVHKEKNKKGLFKVKCV